MKKVLASLAVVAFSLNAHADLKDGYYKATGDLKDAGEKIENSYKEVPNPIRPFAGTLTSPVGNTVQYLAEGLDILGEEGVEGAVKAVVSSGQCIESSTHPGEFAGCVVKLGGDGMIVIWNTAGYSAANVVNFGGEMLSDVAFVWRDAAADLEKAAREAGIPLLPQGAYVAKIVLNAAGVVVKISFSTLADGVRGLVEGGALTVESAVDVPVSLLRLKPKRAVESLAIALGAAGCTVVDTVLVTPIKLGAALLNAMDKGNRKIETCMEQAKKDFRAIRNGTYKPAPAVEQVTP